MSNIKKLDIAGTAPFNLHEDDGMAQMLSSFMCPTTNMKLAWTGQAGYVPNEYGGKTAMYNFQVSGSEAVSWKWVDKFCEEIKRVGGTIKHNLTIDIEG